MVRLPSSVLLRAHRFIFEVHATCDVDALRRVIPSGLGRLVSTERASVNEMVSAPGQRAVVPTPVPEWWARFADVYRQHMADHPIWNPRRDVGVNRIISLGDGRHAAQWRRSALYNEYFRPLGVEHQLSSTIFREGTTHVAIALNRSSRAFTAADRAVVALVSPHLLQAWQTARALAGLRTPEKLPKPGHSKRSAVVAVDLARGTLKTASLDATRIFLEHLGAPLDSGDRLPDCVRRWLRAQQPGIALSGDLPDAPFRPLEIQTASGHLRVRVAQQLTEDALLLLESVDDGPDTKAQCALTPRETEILRWLREGKRNAEIACIVGCSARTVGKHLENIFHKLGVETRTAAVCAAGQALR